MAWILLLSAVVSNVAANFMFKLAMASFPGEMSFGSLARFAFNPYLWLGATSCGLLLGCYLMALREIELVISYAFVISLSLIGIAVLTPWVLGGALSLRSVLGVLLVVAGLITLVMERRTPVRTVAFSELATGEHMELRERSR
jgi:multidrug transporter EmrE-like cation transporter